MAEAGTIHRERALLADEGAVFQARHDWQDASWMATRRERFGPTRPVSIYEVHLGSWMRVPEENNRVLTYGELAPKPDWFTASAAESWSHRRARFGRTWL
jgi:hypothetical protein